MNVLPLEDTFEMKDMITVSDDDVSRFVQKVVANRALVVFRIDLDQVNVFLFRFLISLVDHSVMHPTVIFVIVQG